MTRKSHYCPLCKREVQSEPSLKLFWPVFGAIIIILIYAIFFVQSGAVISGVLIGGLVGIIFIGILESFDSGRCPICKYRFKRHDKGENKKEDEEGREE